MLLKRYPAYLSKDNANCEKHVIPLMIPNGEGPKGCEAKFDGQWW